MKIKRKKFKKVKAQIKKSKRIESLKQSNESLEQVTVWQNAIEHIRELAWQEAEKLKKQQAT